MADELSNSTPSALDGGKPSPSTDNIPNSQSGTPVAAPVEPLSQPAAVTAQVATVISDATPIPAPPAYMMPHPAPPRTTTPNRSVNGTAEAIPMIPAKAASHGAPARRYLNEKVTGVLLEGMKRLAADQPDDPLRMLGEFLIQRSREIEGTLP